MTPEKFEALPCLTGCPGKPACDHESLCGDHRDIFRWMQKAEAKWRDTIIAAREARDFADLQNGELKRLLAEAMKHHLCIQSPCYCLDAWNALNSVTEKQMENGAECLRLAIAERESLKLRVGELKETLRWLGINHAHNAPCPQCMAIAKALTEKQNATGSQYLSGPLGPEGPVAEKQDGEPPNNSPPLSGGESVKCGCCGTIFACNCDCPGS